MSAVGVRYDTSECFRSVDLIVNQGIADILHQTVDFLCILGGFKELREILLGCHRVHSLTNLFQFSDDPRVSDPALDLRECGLTAPAFLPSSSH